MKNIKQYMMALLALPLMAACVDDDYNAPTPAGNPVMSYTAPTAAVEMGDEVEVKVNCKDEGGIALSTLKAQLMFSGQSVADTTIRTKEDGEYTVKFKVPYVQYIPDGQVDIQLTLQNVSTKANTESLSFDVKRPHFNNLQFVTSTGEKYDMTEDGDFQYKAIIDTQKNSFKGHFATKDGKFVFGSNGESIALGETADFNFTTIETGNVTVTFDGKDFIAGPTEKLPVTPIDLANSDAGKTWVGEIKQGATCTLSADGKDLSDEWFYDTDWFTKNEDGTFTFKALTGKYTIQADFEHKGLRIWAMDGNDPMKLAADGTGAIWIIGNEKVNKPTWESINKSWNTGTATDVCLAPIGDKKHQVTLTVGKQLAATDVNFKFFGQADWGIEFKGTEANYHISCDSEVFGIGTGKDASGNGHDDGNIFLKDGVTLNDGDTYVFTIDLSEGVKNGKLTIVKK